MVKIVQYCQMSCCCPEPTVWRFQMTGFPGWKCHFFSAALHLSGGRWELPSALARTDKVAEWKWWTVVKLWGSHNVWGNADAPVSFKSGGRKHFGFPRVKKWERRNGDRDRQTENMQILPGQSEYTPTAPFAHIVRFRAQLLLNKSWSALFPSLYLSLFSNLVTRYY